MNERPELVPVAANARDEFARMRIFVGERKADRYEDLYRRYEEKGHVMGWNWGAFPFAPVWLFYRRLNLEGALFVLIPAALALVHPYLGLLSLGSWMLVYVFANQYYLYRAERKIYEVEKTDFSEAERDQIIKMRGGGTMRGAIAGFLIMATLGAGAIIGPTWNHIDTLKEGLRAENIKKLFSTGGARQRPASRTQLPSCNAKQVEQLVQNMVVNQMKTLNIPSAGVQVGNFSQLSASRVERTCKMTLSGGGQSGNYKVKIIWSDATKKRFSVQLAPM